MKQTDGAETARPSPLVALTAVGETYVGVGFARRPLFVEPCR